ncbi:hypothetical protein TWF102_010674 [Orbilia oligospora]|uniref:Uncharacterized protein n=1 Tax=Orbilia oligospora TaxID=2813651 RepID=A0A7C8JBG6_ORBOL|nr:hypothetical protein TWF102_010674 [Orbilia oligospora]
MVVQLSSSRGTTALFDFETKKDMDTAVYLPAWNTDTRSLSFLAGLVGGLVPWIRGIALQPMHININSIA